MSRNSEPVSGVGLIALGMLVRELPPSLLLDFMTALTLEECAELRDYLFATHLRAQHKENAFRYLAVVPGKKGGDDAIVHFACSPGSWERAHPGSSLPASAEALLNDLIVDSAFAKRKISFHWHNYLRDGWPISWAITAKSSSENFPTLVLYEKKPGIVHGVLMRESHMGDSRIQLAKTAAEPDEVSDILKHFSEMDQHEAWCSWYKDSNIDEAPLEEVIAGCPQTDAGQISVILYRDYEWVHGFWNNPAKHSYGGDNPTYHSIAEFHGLRISKKKRSQRAGVDIVRKKATLTGDFEWLTLLAEQAMGEDSSEAGSCESLPSVKTLSTWWNDHAPESMRSAATFRVYVWDEENKTFLAGDPEEPACNADVFATIPCYAVFEEEGTPLVAVVFYRGREYNVGSNLGTQTFHVNGDKAWDIGEGLEHVDEAYYAHKGLSRVGTLLFECTPNEAIHEN